MIYVKITATNVELEQFCYLPLKSGEVYAAKHSTQGDVEYNTFFDVIVNETIVTGVHESRLKVLNKDEVRDFKLEKILE
jgi:hypothetical protein